MPKFIKSGVLTFLCLFIAGILQAQPTINVVVNGQSGCEPHYVNFVNTTQNVTSHSWVVPGVGSYTTASPGFTIGTAGTYTATYTATNSGGSSTKTFTITVHPAPTPNFTASPSSGCVPLGVTFTDASTPGGSSTITNWTWTFGDGGFSNTKNPTHNYVNCDANGYAVALEVKNSFNCTKTVTKPAFIRANCNPTVNFTATPAEACAPPLTPVFDATPAGGTAPYTYSWDLGNGTNTLTPPFSNPNPYTTQPGQWTVKLTVTDANGCKAEETKTNYIKIHKLIPNFTLSPTQVCVFNPIYVANTTSPGFTSTNWNWGDFTTNGTTPTDNHTYTTPGVKTITLTSTNGICSETISKTVTVHPQPDLDFTFSPPTPCPAPQTIQFFTSGTATSFWWDFGNGTGSGNNPSRMYGSNGWYTITVVGQDGKGCKDTVTKTDVLKIYDGWMEISADTPGGCVPKTVCFDHREYTLTPNLINPVAYPYGIAQYEWDFGDGSPISTAAKPCHTFTTAADTFVVKCKVLTVNGCTFIDTLWIRTGLKPTASFVSTHSDLQFTDSICVDNGLLFRNTSTDTSSWNIMWDFGDGNTINGFRSPWDGGHTYADPGWYDVTLHIANNYCKDTFKVDSAVYVGIPKSEFKHEVRCAARKTVDFINESIGATSQIWYFGDAANSTSTQVSPTFTYPTLGTFSVMLVTFNDSVGCADTLIKSVLLVDTEPFFTATDTTICPNQSVTFTSGMTGGNMVEWKWYVNNVLYNGGPITNFLPVYTHPFGTTGYYRIKLIVKDEIGCIDSVVKVNHVLVSKPTVNFTGVPTSGCAPLTVNFTDNSVATPGSTLVNRDWNFNNGTLTIPGATTPWIFAGAGEYDVKLIVTDDNGCKDSIEKLDYIKAYKPVADFYADDVTGCLDRDIVFTNSSSVIPVNSPSSSWWSFGDSKTDITNAGTIAHRYTSVGVFDVTMVVTDMHGCKDTVQRLAALSTSKPHAEFTMSDTFSVCAPHLVTFTDNSVNDVKWKWEFGLPGGNSTQQNPVYTYTAPGYYNVSLIVEDAEGCTDTALGNVNVLGYDGSLTYTPIVGCAPLEVDFTLQVQNVPQVIWDFNDGNTFVTTTTTPVKHVYEIPGAYLPKVIFSDGSGCTSFSAGKDTIRVDGIFPGFKHSPGCVGRFVQFEDTSKGMFTAVNRWEWIFDNGQTSALRTPIKFYGSVGTFPLKLYLANARGCKDTIDTEIVINALPTVTVSSDTVICLKDAAQLWAEGGVSYTWKPEATLSCNNCPNPNAFPSVTTIYTVIGTDANSCTDTTTVTVGLKTKTDSEVGEGGEMCKDETFQLEASGAERYEWSPASLVSDFKIADPIAGPDASTKFMVLAYEGSCIPDTNYVDVVVRPKPIVRATGEATIIAGASTPIDASGQLIKKFLWTPSESLDCPDCPSTMATPTRTTTYTVTAFTQYNCADSANVTIKVLCDESQLFIPNTFTPNGDGQNDVFYPRGAGLAKIVAFRVYNRWGEVVYDKGTMDLNDKASGWDGTFKGNQQAPDVFVYIVEAQCDNGDILKLKGDITLIR